jgi:polysaccharide chain length determinant protein (PEP-CTERM system associated)
MAADVESSRSLSDYGAILRRRWKLLLAIIPSALLVATFLAYTLPPLYQSSATILLEGSTIAQDVVKTTAVTQTAQQVELVQRAVMSPARVEKLLAEVDPYPGQQLTPKEKARQIVDNTSFELVDPITLKPLPESNAFSIYYLNPDPALARKVMEGLTGLFFDYSREMRQGQAGEARTFLESRSKEVDAQVRAVEQRMALFKQRHGDALPDSRVRNEAGIDRTQRDMDAADAQVRLYEQQEQLLKLQLAQVNPMLIAATGDSFTQIAAVRAELAAAQQRYTPDHPDIKRLQRVLQSLIEQGKSTQASGVVPDNPEYLRIQAELSTVRANLAAQRSMAARARTQLGDYEQRMVSSPEVEREYVALEREHEILQGQLVGFQNKLREAEVAQSLESEDKGQRYTVIRPPGYPSSPASPNRMGIILLGLVLGGGIAIALAIMREGADPTVRDSRDIAALGGLSVIGTIPVLLNDADRRRRRMGWTVTAAAYSAALVIVAITVLRAS